MSLVDVAGKTLPLNKDDFSYDDWSKLTGTLGFAATELIGVAQAIDTKNAGFFAERQDNLSQYYRTLAQNLAAIQQILFGYNVTGNETITFANSGDKS